MTYQEIRDRLSKCELTLEKLKNGKNSENIEVQKKIKKLSVLRESYQRRLKESNRLTAFIDGRAVDIENKKDLDKFKDNRDIDSIETGDGKKIKEQEGVKFSVDETKAIAKKVGKAVAISLKSLGDAVKSMKAKNIEENSFDIQVNYKGEGPEDSFSFYITDDTLHLTDFSFDKELTDVGVKPSGEAIVNVDVVANELQKHFKAMNEAEVAEAPDNMYYFKVPRTDKAKLNAAQNTIETFYDPVRFADIVDDDGAGNVIMYIHKKDFDPGMIDDLQGDGIDLSSSNFPGVNEGEKEEDGADTDYARRRREEDDYYEDPDYYKEEKETDDYGRPHVDPKGSRTFLEPDEMLPHNRFKKMAQKEDKDIGHQDDEPNMLGASALETAEYAAKLYKKLQRYDNFDGEVDFPHWWQKKLVLARDYMSAAFHYLDSEEKQPAIDKLALENVDKVAGGIPYKREGNKFIISEPLDDATKERIIGRAKEHGHNAAPNQAGGVTIMAKENVNEELSDDQRDALEELENILNQAGDLGSQARDIIAQSFPNYLSQGDAYGAFNFGDSSNSYDTTLSSIVQSIYDGDEDIDEGRKDKDALYPDNPRLPEIKNLADKIISMVKAEAAKGELGYIKTMEEIRYQQEHDFERTPEWNKAHGIRSDFDDYGSGTNEGRNVDDLYDTTINTMKRLAKKYKAGDKSVVPHLKKLTDIKKKLEQEKIKKASNIGKGQELTEGRGDMDAIKRIIDDRAAESGFEEREEAAEVIAAIAEEYMLSLKVIQAYMDSDGPVNPHDVNEIELSKKQISKLKDIVKQLKKSVKGHDAQQKYINKLVKKEAAPGFKHDCAAKVVHEKYGNGTCIPEKHTLVKEGNKYVVTHYDVLFENGNTVLDIPVNELEIKTQTEHWHKGYKKKKK